MHVTLTAKNFNSEVLESQKVVLVIFSAEWCGSCHMMAPVIDQLASDFQGQAKVGRLDVDETAHIAAQYGIRSTPTLLFFKHGHLVDQLVGVAPKRVLAEKLHALIQQS